MIPPTYTHHEPYVDPVTRRLAYRPSEVMFTTVDMRILRLLAEHHPHGVTRTTLNRAGITKADFDHFRTKTDGHGVWECLRRRSHEYLIPHYVLGRRSLEWLTPGEARGNVTFVVGL